MIRVPKIVQIPVGDTTIRAGIWQLAAVACGALIVVCLLLAWSVERYRQASDWMTQSQTILGGLHAYSNLIVTLETGQRGYILTQQPEYLAPYWQALNGEKSRFALLTRRISDADEQRTLQRLSVILQEKKKELARTIQLTQTGHAADAIAIVREGAGRRYTVEFQRLSQAIADKEAATLANRRAAVEAEMQNTQLGVFIGGIVAIILIVGAARLSIARFDRRARYLIGRIEAIADKQLQRPVGQESLDENNQVVRAFNKMADRLLAARQARDAIEADLAQSHQTLVAEVRERTAAQKHLSLSVAELKRSNDELDSFAYGASHDLKAPLRGIRSLTEWITQDVAATAGDETVANLGLLRNRVERLDMLLDSLLQYSRVGRSGGAPEDIDIAGLVGDIAQYMAPRAGFTVSTRGEFPLLRADKAPFEQVLRNLIGNGLKHHDKNSGTVVVSARDLGSFVEIRVEDDGPGIAAMFHERIFKMFQTLQSRDAREGSGMGLAIVKKSVESHGGTICIESNLPQRGTAFIFSWQKTPLALAA